ncbi:TPA: hypothetical protein ACHV9O_001743 [Listeria monocytogenes]|uniref:hypothetical protein n=1 Tax=Listeria TaxID=1637 RepID=UPI000EE3055B|nr:MULTISPECIES: hypothetical protein [Listeria]RKB76911.1 hypothetical protein HM22_01466 [Listeria monocytogenes]
MAYETAYSKELKRNDITALEANQYFHEGILTDSKAFQCSEVCSVPLTCANFTKNHQNGINLLTLGHQMQV